MPPSSPQVVLTADGLHVSSLDDRSYRYVELPNGLHALLVSDPETESASAAMDVAVGFHSDPEELPGLAHFCEHMLFLGTAKYPDENSYSAFLNAHGGGSNAFTAARHTNYYFDVAAAHLEPALDRFAQFFLAPLFTASATDRELNAVHAEFKNYLHDDYWRLNQAHRARGNPRHPFHRFGVGNRATLDRDDVRDALLRFYDAFYVAHLMRLVVYGREDLATLERWVRDRFSSVRDDASVRVPRFRDLGGPFTDAQLARRLDVLPVKDLQLVVVAWVLPPLHGRDEDGGFTEQHAAMLAHLLGHEGHGSLLSLLKRRAWVTTLHAGVDEEFDEFAHFTVTFEATRDGVEHVDDIVAALFQCLALLRAAPVEPWVFDEQQALAIMHFLFQSKQPPMSYTSALAANLHRYARRDVLTQNALFFPHDAAHIERLLSWLSPERMRLLVVSKSLEGVVDQDERWYGTRFRDTPLSPEQLARWRLSSSSDPTATATDADADALSLSLPTRNEFVATDFSLIDAERVTPAAALLEPQRLRDDARTRLWYRADVRFRKPRTHAALTFYSPAVNASPLSFVLSDLVVLCVQDELTEYAYDASLAGLHYDLAVQGSSVHLGAVGFSAKLPLLVHRVVETLAALATSLSRETFDRVLQAARRDYDNLRLDEAYRVAMHDNHALVGDRHWSVDDLVAAIAQVDLPMLRRHSRRIWDQCFLEAFVYGNLYAGDACTLVEDVLQRMPAHVQAPLPSQHAQWHTRQLRLPDGAECVWRRRHPNAENPNCALDAMYQIGVETPRDRVTLGVLSTIVQEPFFHQLRTTEQLGYTVFSTPGRQSGVQHLRLLVQSNVAAPEFLAQRVDAFWATLRRTVECEMTDAQLEQHIQTVVKSYAEKPKSQEEEVQDASYEIAIREYQFDRKARLAALVQTVRRNDLLQFLDRFIMRDAPQRKLLSVRIYGSGFPVPELQSTTDVTPSNDATATATATALVAAWSLQDGGDSSSVRIIEDMAEFKQQLPLYGSKPDSSCSTARL
ncbi:hypothetical protein PINS_up006853 [Pythium insidiosum]|nr:hypothetical protein PINS_up006853 [Pythium insidiosum]